MGLTLSDTQLQQCDEYLLLLDKWNRVHNLTSIQNFDDRVTKHLLDSLTIVPYLSNHRIIDIGSGAGLPGIPLAIYYPNYYFELLDANAKKTAFLDQCRRTLKLSNITVVHSRVEDYRPEKAFDTIICRAFSDLANIVSKTTHLCSNNAIILAMKGRFPQQELEQLVQHGLIYEVHPLTVPGLDAERHVVKILTGEAGG